MAGRASSPPPANATSITMGGRGHRTGKSISKSAGISLRPSFRRIYSIFSNNRMKEKENTVKKQPTRAWMIAGLFAFVSLGLTVTPALSHHSFAMYDQTKTVTLTGVAHQFVAQANHAELHFYLVGADGKLTKGSDGKYVDYG